MRPAPIAALLCATVALVTLAAPAPATAEPVRPSHSVGLYVSNIAGSGLTYALDNGPGGMGFHVSGIGWGQGGSSFFNVGGALTKSLARQEWGNLYGLAAVGVGASTSASSGTGAVPRLETNFAPGLGVQMGFMRVELGYSFYTNASGSGFTPAGGAGMFVTF